MNSKVKAVEKTSGPKQANPGTQKQKIALPQSQHPSVEHIFFLQRTIGNQAVQRLLAAGIIQAKLKTGQPGNKYQQEARQLESAPEDLISLSSAKEDPKRYQKIYENLIKVSGGGKDTGKQPWGKNTTQEIIDQFTKNFPVTGDIWYFEGQEPEPVQCNSTSTRCWAIPQLTNKKDAENAAVTAQERLIKRFPQIRNPKPVKEIQDAVLVLTPQKVATDDYLREWLGNKLPRYTDVEKYAYKETDSGFQSVLTQLLYTKKYQKWGSEIKQQAKRVSSSVETPENGERKIWVNQGLPPEKHMAVLIHEMTHFNADPKYRAWVAQTTSEDWYNEGFAEYLAQLAMTATERSARGSYSQRVDEIEEKVARYVSDDDIARAYFAGEVWRLEQQSEIAKEQFKSQLGMDPNATRATEKIQSVTSPGICQVVIPGEHYRFMNLGIEKATPKPEHINYFKKEIKEKILDNPDEIGNQIGALAELTFIGHTSSTGSLEYNRRLSKERVTQFYKMALDQGVPENQLPGKDNPPHHGEIFPTVEENDSVLARAFNRRVELKIKWKKAPG